MEDKKYKPRLIKDIDPELWRKFVGVAKIKGMKAGKLLNELLFTFLEKQKVIDNSSNKPISDQDARPQIQ